MITRRRIAVAAGVLALAVIVLITPRSEDPDSTLALRRFLEYLGVDVSEREGLPSDGGTLVLLDDLRGPDEARPLLDWAQAGGHLIVADPASEIVGMVGAAADTTLGFANVVELQPRCVAPEVIGVQRIVARATDRILVAQDPALVGCFPSASGALLLTRPYGEGTVTLLGGSSMFTNELLREADNPVLAAGLAGHGPDVVFGPPATSVPGTAGIWDVLPDAARAALIAIVVAAVAFALGRARRLGGPMIEEPIAPIAGSELVRAAGRLYRMRRATGYAGTLMRQAAITRLSGRFVSPDVHDLSGMVARTSGIPRDRVERILAGPEPRTDEDLIALGDDLEGLSAKAEMRDI